MVTLDFSKCKSVEDVNKVFGKSSSELENAKAMMDRVQNPDKYCNICGKRLGICKHSRLSHNVAVKKQTAVMDKK